MKRKGKKGRTFARERIESVVTEIRANRHGEVAKAETEPAPILRSSGACCAAAYKPIRQLARPPSGRTWWEVLPHYQKRIATAGNQS